MTDVTQYSDALFSLACEAGREEKIGEELSALASLISKNPKYISLLDTPALHIKERTALIDEALAPFDEYLRSLVKLLAEKRLVHTVPSLSKRYSEMYDEHRGILRAEAISAVPMTEGQIKRLEEGLSRETEKTVIIKNTVDKSILGGLVLRYAGLSEDGSLKHRLEVIEKNLYDAKI